jgi:sterol desaturase/sphingolipid hydroxylase (fatty acid hydroxylase superfamily)
MAFASLLLVCGYYVQEINGFIETSWKHHISTLALFNHESFELVLSSATFSVVMSIWVMIDFYLPYFHKYRISDSDDVSAWRGRETALWNETIWYIATKLVLDFFFFQRRILPLQAPTLLAIVWQVSLALFVYDLIFVAGHYAFHASRFLYKHVHAVHHSGPIIRATDTIRHTFWEGAWGVLCTTLALYFTRPHPLSRAIYYIVSISLVAEAHSGMNFPWGLHNILPFHIIAGPVIHETHHRIGRVNYQQYLTCLDYLAGTLKIEPTLQEKEKE